MPIQVAQNTPSIDPNVKGQEGMIKNAITRLGQLKARREPWNDQYQLLGEFIHMLKQEFQTEHTVGEFLTREIFDSVGPRSAKTASSILISDLWPNTKGRIKFFPPDKLKGTKAEKEYYEFADKRVLRTMDDPKAGFGIATDEYMLDQVVLGTSGVEFKKDKKTILKYIAWGVKHMYIAEGADKQVDTIYIVRKLSTSEIVKSYGLENVSEKTRKEFEEGKFDTQREVLLAIEPRISRMQDKANAKNMPWSSLTIEIESKHLIRESGFEELPILVGRLIKLLDEVQGRSLGMDALPDIQMANTVMEAYMVGVEKSLDPPLGVYSDGVLGGGEIDTSAGAINVFNPSDQAKERAPIFPLFTIDRFDQILNLIQHLGESIANHFLIDRLLDFNNETRMTLGEVNIRDRMRGASLGSIYRRQISSYFTPAIERTFAALLEAGELGLTQKQADEQEGGLQPGQRIIPETIAKLMADGEDVFDLRYFTPAMRVMQSEEAEGIIQTLEVAGKLVEIGKPEVIDGINGDETLALYRDIVGAPSEMSFSEVEILKTRADRNVVDEDIAEQEEQGAMAENMRNVGQSGLVPTEKPREAE